MFVLAMISLLSGILIQNVLCETLGTNNSSGFKDMLFITAESVLSITTFPTEMIYHNSSGLKFCFNIPANKSNAGCCKDFDCSAKINKPSPDTEEYNLVLNQTTLSRHDIVVLRKPTHFFSCVPALFCNSTGFLLNLHKCLKINGSDGWNIRLSQGGLCGCPEGSMTEAGETQMVIKVDGGSKTCQSPSCTSPVTTTAPTTVTIAPAATSTTTKSKTTTTKPPTATEIHLSINISRSPTSPDEAVNVMNNLSSILEMMGSSSTATITMGKITGALAKLPPQNQTGMNFHFTASGEVNTIQKNESGFYREIQIPKEASEMALKQNGSYAGILLFPGMIQDGSSRFFFNNEILGIEMGANISNLSETINIRYSFVNTSEGNASCRSWDGKENSNWITDGCQTVETNGSITCRCSHLTFFAILMSPAPTNISASDYKTLAKITEAGCGVSMFFLGVGLFMHFILRKTKATNATKILINLFVAMFFLNFGFLINKTIADLKNDAGCVAIAAFLHYSMLATFTWFSLQALHLYNSLRKFPANIRHYMCKLYTTGWVAPAVVIVPLLALMKYGNIVIHVDDGSSANMCWIPDSAIHLGINVGYYAIVFLFTFSIFIITVRQIIHIDSKALCQENNSTKKRFISILGLFCLLGISWAFAFFSYGPLLIPSYYTFTILNSFQGFLLFIYYYYSTKITPEAKPVSHSLSNTVTENVYAASPYQ